MVKVKKKRTKYYFHRLHRHSKIVSKTFGDVSLSHLVHAKIYFVDSSRTHPEAGGDGAGIGLFVVKHYGKTMLRLSPRDRTEERVMNYRNLCPIAPIIQSM